jgi:hypothetical protein
MLTKFKNNKNFLNKIYLPNHALEKNNLKILNTCLNTNIYSYLNTSGGQSYNLYLNVHFSKTNVN